MLKRRTIILIVILVLIFAFVILYLLATPPKKSDDSKDFLENKYVSFDGGEEAEKFFKNYIDIINCKNITFLYRNYENKLTLYKAHTLFCVDVEYTVEQYTQNFDKIFPETDCPEIEKGYNYYGDYLITTIMVDDHVYENNYCGVFFNSQTNTIRYVFLYDINREHAIESDPRRLINMSSAELDWE